MTPAGFLDFGPALAKAAASMHREAWDSMPPRERDVLLQGGPLQGLFSRHATKEGSLASLTYSKFRPMLAAGTLPSKLRLHVGAPQLIVAASWYSSSADHLLNVITGRAAFALTNDTTETGPVLIEERDLDAILDDRAAPSLSQRGQTGSAPSRQERAEVKRGRPSHPDVDAFWIEAARYVYTGKNTAPLAGFVAAMADWAASNMTAPYDEETIRKKLAGLVRALNRPDGA